MKNEQLPFHISVLSTITVKDLRSYADGWLLDCEVRNLSPTTLAKRRLLLEKFFWFLHSREIPAVDKDTIRKFLAYCKTGHTDPDGRWGNPKETEPNKPGTVASYHGLLRSLFNWIAAEEDYDATPMRKIAAPIDRPDHIQPFTTDQVEALLAATRRSKHARRDEAILLFLLDTGVRVSEMCQICMRNLDMRGRSVVVQGKGDKTRQVHFGKRMSKALWQYLRQEERDEDSPVFLSEGVRSADDAMTRNGVLLLIRRLGRQAGIEQVRCSPHTFRHTFAIEFLRNGGNQFTLMYLLGHTNTKMTARYVAIAQADAARQHAQNSPVDRLKQKL